MYLPPELINRILEYLTDDSQSLKAVSLVSKTWTTWCQARLFESVRLTPPVLQRWLKDVSQEADGPASHTRTLALEEYRLIPWINPQYLDFPPSALSSFSDVKSLSLIQWNATLFSGASPEPHFCHFSKSLCRLSLQFCMLDPVILFDFLSLLPNVDDLDIAYPYISPGGLRTIQNVPDTSPSFRGTLSLAGIQSDRLILKVLTALLLRFSTIRIKSCAFYGPDEYQTLLTGCGDTLVTLRFEKCYHGALRAYPELVQCVFIFPNF